MKLHNNKESFIELLALVSDYYKIDISFVEKDYYVTLLLKELSNKLPNLLFKGGTSLSKCYKLINRFSEDIDLTLEKTNLTQGQKKQMKIQIIEACNKFGLSITNLEEIRSRRDFNCYKIEYPIQHQSIGINPLLLVETSYISKSYPYENSFVTSIIYNYLKEINKNEIIEKYELEPFIIRVQSLNRTLVDKVFAICDYAISNRIARNSRHIYDLYQLLSKVQLNDELKKLIKEVRMERKLNSLCYSAKDNVNISELLEEIIRANIYKEDYEKVTKYMLFKYISYEEVIKALEVIANSGVFN